MVIEIAAQLEVTPTQIGLAWLLERASNILLIPGTANPDHLEANIGAASIRLGSDILARLDAFEPPTPGEIEV
jgi:pyridoxine 4-dehydrogenase